jgi:hypothetical protein
VKDILDAATWRAFLNSTSFYSIVLLAASYPAYRGLKRLAS